MEGVLPSHEQKRWREGKELPFVEICHKPEEDEEGEVVVVVVDEETASRQVGIGESMMINNLSTITHRNSRNHV